MPNHGVASGAGSTTSTLGPRREGGNGYYALAKSPSLHLQQPLPSDSLFSSILTLFPSQLTEPRFSERAWRGEGRRAKEEDFAEVHWEKVAFLDPNVRCLLAHLAVRSEVKPTLPVLPSWPMTLTFPSVLFQSQLCIGNQGVIWLIPHHVRWYIRSSVAHSCSCVCVCGCACKQICQAGSTCISPGWNAALCPPHGKPFFFCFFFSGLASQCLTPLGELMQSYSSNSKVDWCLLSCFKLQILICNVAVSNGARFLARPLAKLSWVFSWSGRGSETEQGGRINLPKSDSLGHHAKAVASIQKHTL